MTLDEMKRYLLSHYGWRKQKGPNDTFGRQRDNEIEENIRTARTWGDLEDVAPTKFGEAVSNRCRKEEL